MTRYDLRDAVRERKRALEGTVASDPEPPTLPLSASDLTDEASQAMAYRSADVGQRHRVGFEAGWVAACIWLEALDCFRREP